MTSAVHRLTVRDLECLPDPMDDTRYELIDGELHVSRQPSYQHQMTCHRLQMRLGTWSEQTGLGEVIPAPGVIFAPEDAVAPDVVWVSRERLPHVLNEDGKLQAAPDLMIEVLSPGAHNERRDRKLKLELYSLYGVREYWIVSWQSRSVTVYRREQAVLNLIATRGADDALESPLLPGFRCAVRDLFVGLT